MKKLKFKFFEKIVNAIPLKFSSKALRASKQGVEPNLNPNEPFHFGETEPNLNQQNFASVNLNQT